MSTPQKYIAKEMGAVREREDISIGKEDEREFLTIRNGFRSTLYGQFRYFRSNNFLYAKISTLIPPRII